jgi:hypothetical protein
MENELNIFIGYGETGTITGVKIIKYRKIEGIHKI